jgi:hypothetical protein
MAGSCLLESADDGTRFAKDYPDQVADVRASVRDQGRSLGERAGISPERRPSGAGRLTALPGARQRQRFARECSAGSASRVELVVLATRTALLPRDSRDLEHRLGLLAQITGKVGAVMASPLDRPETSTGRAPPREPKRLHIAASVCRDRALRDNRADRHRDNRKYVLVPVRVDADHVIHLI